MDLDHQELECRVEFRRLFVLAENERRAHDELLHRKISENEKKEQKGKEERDPSDMEMQEGKFSIENSVCMFVFNVRPSLFCSVQREWKTNWKPNMNEQSTGNICQTLCCFP